MSKRCSHSVFLILIFLFVSQSAISQNKRIELVIGVQSYSTLPSLRNSLNDAKDISASLIAKGFVVESLYDPKTRKEIKDAINRYYNAMRDQVGAVGVIFYAGHGIQYQGDNYLLPTTATLQNPGDLDDYCVKMNGVMSVLKSSSKSLNILLLDACQTLPSFTRDSEQGLTRMEAPQGSIIVFATQPGKVASDGAGKNGLFTSKFLNTIDNSNLNISDVLKKVKQEVYSASGEQQLPSVEDNSIGGDFYFNNKDGNSKIVVPAATKSKPITPEKNNLAQRGSTRVVPFDYGYGPADVPIVMIGKQEWMKKNLNVDHFNNDDLIPQAKTDAEWQRAGEEKRPAWCYYENDAANGTRYGRMYNWYAVQDLRGLCPTEWHVPDDVEWTALADNLGGQSTAGISIKSDTLWYNNGHGTDKSGFTALPAGARKIDGLYDAAGKGTIWWTASEESDERSWDRYLSFWGTDLGRYNARKGYGFYVRCVKNAP